MKQTYLITRTGEESFRVIPAETKENKNKKSNPKKSQREAVIRKVRLVDYGEGEGFSVMPLKNTKNQEPTMFKLKEFPVCKIFYSKNRMNIRISFDKSSRDDAKRIIKRDLNSWFEEIERFCKAPLNPPECQGHREPKSEQ